MAKQSQLEREFSREFSRSKSKVNIHESEVQGHSKHGYFDNNHHKPQNRASISNAGSTMNKSKDSLNCPPHRKKVEEPDRNNPRDKSKEKSSVNAGRSFYDDSKFTPVDTELLKTQNSYYGQLHNKPYFKEYKVSQKSELEILREKQVNVQVDDREMRRSVTTKNSYVDQTAKNVKSYLGMARKEQQPSQLVQNAYGLTRKKTISDLNSFGMSENAYGQKTSSVNQSQVARNKSTGKSPLIK